MKISQIIVLALCFNMISSGIFCGYAHAAASDSVGAEGSSNLVERLQALTLEIKAIEDKIEKITKEILSKEQELAKLEKKPYGQALLSAGVGAALILSVLRKNSQSSGGSYGDAAAGIGCIAQLGAMGAKVLGMVAGIALIGCGAFSLFGNGRAAEKLKGEIGNLKLQRQLAEKDLDLKKVEEKDLKEKLSTQK
jgi:hypothetical protein